MTETLAIARNTFKEAIRNRILYVILIFALLMIMFSGVLGMLTISNRERVIKDLGFMASNLFGVAIAVFIGVSLVFNELEKKTIYTIVSKPIGRWQFLVGKYLGLLGTVWCNVLVMAFFLLASVHYYSLSETGDYGFMASIGLAIARGIVSFFKWNAYEITQTIMPVILFTCIELAIVTAFAVLFSSFSTPFLSMFFTILVFVAGRECDSILRFAETIKQSVIRAAEYGEISNAVYPPSYHAAMWLAHIVPNLGAYHWSVEQASMTGASVQIWWGAVVYGLFYAAGVMCLAIVIFTRRNFK